jgi:hypothetical protein
MSGLEAYSLAWDQISESLAESIFRKQNRYCLVAVFLSYNL